MKYINRNYAQTKTCSQELCIFLHFFPEGIMNNPWTGDLDKYLFYCCPECDERSISKDIFIGHALTHHPQVMHSNAQ